MHFEQNTSVCYRAISHADSSNLNLKFFFRSNNLHKIIKISKKTDHKSSDSAANNVTRTHSNR